MGELYEFSRADPTLRKGLLRSLSSGIGTKLRVDVCEVSFDGAFREVKGRSNPVVAHPAGDEKVSSSRPESDSIVLWDMDMITP